MFLWDRLGQFQDWVGRDQDRAEPGAEQDPDSHSRNHTRSQYCNRNRCHTRSPYYSRSRCRTRSLYYSRSRYHSRYCTHTRSGGPQRHRDCSVPSQKHSNVS